jgi:hypothetical protein
MSAAARILPPIIDTCCPYCQQQMPCGGDHAYAKPIPRLPVCDYCGNWTDADFDTRITCRGDGSREVECGECRIRHDEYEAENGRPELEIEEFWGT